MDVSAAIVRIREKPPYKYHLTGTQIVALTRDVDYFLAQVQKPSGIDGKRIRHVLMDCQTTTCEREFVNHLKRRYPDRFNGASSLYEIIEQYSPIR